MLLWTFRSSVVDEKTWFLVWLYLNSNENASSVVKRLLQRHRRNIFLPQWRISVFSISDIYPTSSRLLKVPTIALFAYISDHNFTSIPTCADLPVSYSHRAFWVLISFNPLFLWATRNWASTVFSWTWTRDELFAQNVKKTVPQCSLAMKTNFQLLCDVFVGVVW